MVTSANFIERITRRLVYTMKSCLKVLSSVVYSIRAIRSFMQSRVVILVYMDENANAGLTGEKVEVFESVKRF